ncbi:MAG: hypothetical protein IJZ00_01775 [Lachnospiraceae bacterium]|nr:hypothetical protein [Lachnospiraceae bacterium]
MKMKKKDIIINILCVLWIIFVLILKFNGEYTVEKIENLSTLDVIKEETILLLYSIEKNENTLSFEEISMSGISERQLATLCVLEDGSVFFLNTSQPISYYVENNSLAEITYSAYWMGKLSTVELLFIKGNRFLINTESGLLSYPGFDSVIYEPQNTDGNEEGTHYENDEKKERQYACLIYCEGEENKTMLISSNSLNGGYWHIMRDINALILIPWLRTSWHYWEYIDLMYQELYPWLVEE